MLKNSVRLDVGDLLDQLFGAAEDVKDRIEAEMARNLPFGKGLGLGDIDYYPAYSYPPMNVYLTPDKTMVLEWALAGFEAKDLSLRFQGDFLLFSAGAPAEDEGVKDLKHLKRRLKFKAVEDQKYYVPADKFDQGQVNAVFRNGLLRVTVAPKAGQAAPEGQVIPITAE